MDGCCYFLVWCVLDGHCCVLMGSGCLVHTFWHAAIEGNIWYEVPVVACSSVLCHVVRVLCNFTQHENVWPVKSLVYASVETRVLLRALLIALLSHYHEGKTLERDKIDVANTLVYCDGRPYLYTGGPKSS